MLRRSWIGRGILCALAALLAFAPGRASAAGGSLSYEDAVGEALRHSARLKVKNEEIHINEASWRQSLSSLYPTIALNGRLERFGNLAGPTGIGTINGQVVGGLQDEWRSSVFVLGEYTLSNWFKKRYESHYYERLTEASIHDSEAEKKKVVLEVTDLYGSLAEGAIRLRYLGQMIDRMKEAVSLRAAAHKEGEISHEDLLRAEVQVVDLEKERTEPARQFKENLTRLTLYTGIEYEEDVMVQSLGAAAEVAERPEPDRVEQTPEYRAKRKEVEAQQEKGRAARNNLLPDVGVYGRYDFYGRKPEVRRDRIGLGVLSWIATYIGMLELVERAAARVRRRRDRVGGVFPGRGLARQPGHHPRAHAAATHEVPDPVVEDPVEERPPLVGRPGAIAARETDHRVLHDVEGIVVVPHRHPGDAKGAALDAGQKPLQRLRLIQPTGSRFHAPPAGHRHGEGEIKTSRGRQFQWRLPSACPRRPDTSYNGYRRPALTVRHPVHEPWPVPDLLPRRP